MGLPCGGGVNESLGRQGSIRRIRGEVEKDLNYRILSWAD